MANFSNYIENALLGATLCGSTYTSVVTVYLSLATSIANDGNTFVEVPSGTAYVRQRIQFGTPVNGVVRNSNLITFPTPTTPWGAICHVGIYDAPTSGNLLYWGTLTNTRVINTGEIFQTPINSLSVTLD